MKKKAFSMIELLIVMGIISLLVAIAIPSMSSSNKSEITMSMKSDALNTIDLIVAKKIFFEDIRDIITASGINLKDTNGDGFSNVLLVDGTKVPISKDNDIRLDAIDCSGNGGYADGFLLHVTNAKYLGLEINFNSCINGGLVINN